MIAIIRIFYSDPEGECHYLRQKIYTNVNYKWGSRFQQIVNQYLKNGVMASAMMTIKIKIKESPASKPEFP